MGAVHRPPPHAIVVVPALGGLRPEIRGRDGLERLRPETEHRGESAAADAVPFHRCEVVAAHQRSGKKLQHGGLQCPEGSSEADDRARLARHLAGVAHELAQRVNRRAAKRVSLPDRRRQPERPHDALGHVTDVHRLEPRIGARERHHRGEAQQPREQIEECVFAPEDHRWLDDRPVETGRRHRRLGFALAPEVAARSGGIGIECAHVYEPAHARRLAGGDHVVGEIDVRLLERLAAGFVQDSDKVDDGRRAPREARQLVRAVDIGRDDADRGQHEEGPRLVARSCRDDHALAPGNQAIHDLAADETAAPHDKNRPLGHRSHFIFVGAGLPALDGCRRRARDGARPRPRLRRSGMRLCRTQ